MYCPHCGKQIDDQAALCPYCGNIVDDAALDQPAAPAPVPAYVPPPAPVNNGYAVTGFILAFFIPFVGLILSIIGCKNSKELGGKGKGLAIAGIILSIIMFAAQTVGLVFLIGGMVSCTDSCIQGMSNCTIDCNYGSCSPNCDPNCDVHW